MRQCQTANLLRNSSRPALLVSLPANDPDLARAAIAGGAEGLKVHTNQTHRASGTRLGTLEEEAAGIAEIVALGLPVGIVPGADPDALLPADLQHLLDLGLDYLDMYLSALPAWVLGSSPIGVMAAVGPEEMQHALRLHALADLPGVDMVEASQVPHAGYGLALSAADLCDYTGVVALMAPRDKPVVVPTQRAIRPDDLPSLAGAGVSAVLIGAIVTGRDAAGVEAVTRRFRDALDALRATAFEA